MQDDYNQPIWTPSGPVIEVTASSSIYSIGNKTNGVARIVNIDASAVAFLSIVSLSATIGEHTQKVSVGPASYFFVQLGQESQGIIANGGSLRVQPGYALK
jgi:hypothetical protein